jgi:hypothetical protein
MERREVFRSLLAQGLRDAIALPQDQRQRFLQSLPLEVRLAGLSAEQIQQYLDQLTAGHPAPSRKARRKK